MTRYALLLRGVNVGAKNKLPMAELRRMLDEIGCTDVSTYIQSGNAVLSTTRPQAELLAAVEDALAAFMGRPVATTLRTQAELRSVIDGNPFEEQAATQPKFLCVTFLSGPPTADALAPLEARDWAPEAFHVAGSEIYTWHPDGQGRSDLAVALGKARFDGVATTRNWNTVRKLHEMLEAG